MNQEYFGVALSPEVNLAIPLTSMGDVIQVEINNICPIPGVADLWHGAINFRGSLLWVLDSDRYFELNNEQNYRQEKYTAIIIKPNQADSSQKIALIVAKLQGIIALSPEHLEQLTKDSTSSLERCCSAVAEYETKRTFILNPTNLLKQLHQQSALVSA